MDISIKLKQRRKELSLTMLEVAQKVGVSEATISRWESGDIANMRRDKIVSLANALEVSPSFIMGGDEATESKFATPNITEDYTTFPVIGEIAAGYDHIAAEDWKGDTVDIPNSYLLGHTKKDFFVLRVIGDSMYPLYQNGDKVLILRQNTLNESGDIGAIIYDNEIATLKKIEYVKGENWIRLVPINPTYKPELIEGTRIESCRVLGIPKLLIREID